MGKKILYAEDEPELAHVLSRALEDAGYEVRICDNGREVLPALESAPPDLVILDLMMPGLDGLEIVRQLGNNPRLDKVPVVVTTALGHMKRSLDQYWQVRHFLVKPFSASTLVQAVRNCTGEKQAV